MADTSTLVGNDEQQECMVDNEGRDKESGKGNGSGDKGGGRAMAMMVKKRVRAARAMWTRVVGGKEGGGEFSYQKGPTYKSVIGGDE